MENNTENTGSFGYGNPPEHTKWKKGDPSPNPAGKPKGPTAKTIIRKWLSAKETVDNTITGKKQKLSQLDIIILEQLKKAKEGDTPAFNALLDRAEGKPKQIQEITGLDGQPIQTESTVTSNIDYSKLPTDVLQQIVNARIKKSSDEVDS